jgi:hypothetical protein
LRRFVLSATAVAVAFGIGLGVLVDPAQAPAGARRAAGSETVKEAAAVRSTSSVERLAPDSDYMLDEIALHRNRTWHYQRLMSRARTPYTGSAARSRHRAYRRWVRDLWHRRATTARRQAANPPHRAQWECIHRYEGSWSDPSAPYWGGLQMDWSFMATYGGELLRRKGTADNWTPIEQMWVAERAFRSGRGFGPWPNTARYCGLL